MYSGITNAVRSGSKLWWYYGDRWIRSQKLMMQLWHNPTLPRHTTPVVIILTAESVIRIMSQITCSLMMFVCFSVFPCIHLHIHTAIPVFINLAGLIEQRSRPIGSLLIQGIWCNVIPNAHTIQHNTLSQKTILHWKHEGKCTGLIHFVKSVCVNEWRICFMFFM